MGREGGELVVFANRLKAALAAAEKTQRDVARLLNVAESTVSQWVSGKR
ncbi:helix-turn-helix domain-containing protein [Symbiobacterium thermophilum]